MALARFQGRTMGTTEKLSMAGIAFLGLITAAVAIQHQTPKTEPTKVAQLREQEGRITIRDFDVAQDGTVSGELCNVSNEPVRDVRLVIERTWVGNEKLGTGTDDAARTEFHTVEQTIPPGGKLPFTYRPSAPLPNPATGHYDTAVGIVGLVAIGPSTAGARKCV